MRNYLQSLLRDKRVLILGYGREGKSTLHFLTTIDHNADITIADNNENAFRNDQLVKESGVRLISGDNYLNDAANYDIIIKSPGIAINKIQDKLNHVTITSQTDLFLTVYGKQVIGVTGTKGKSTTSSLIYHILKNYTSTLFGGNIGLPLFELVDLVKEDTKIVCELSSHQLEFATHSPHIGILLNLYQEHLDHYNSYLDYQKAKYNIALYQDSNDYFIYPHDDENINALITNHVSKGEKLPVFQDEFNGSGIGIKDNEVIIKTSNSTIKVLPTIFKLNLIGEHNRNNAIIAASVAALIGVPSNIISDAISSFQALEHRLEFVGIFNDAFFYNDSISTIPEATIAAIESLKPVDTIILGGFDRGIDYSQLTDYLVKSGIKYIVATGPAGKHIFELLKERSSNENLYYFDKFDDCVNKAIALTPKNGVCLLSPAASSYNEFVNFEYRGRRFRELVIQHSTLKD